MEGVLVRVAFIYNSTPVVTGKYLSRGKNTVTQARALRDVGKSELRSRFTRRVREHHTITFLRITRTFDCMSAGYIVTNRRHDTAHADAGRKDDGQRL